MPKAFVVIPTYNERENIAKVIPLLLEVFQKCTGWQMNILVVDDTSPDKTYEVVQELQKKSKHIHLVINKKKGGLGGAYLRGMDEAFDKLDADVVFEFDADLSHDATKIPDFLTKIEEGNELVLGSRYIKGGGIPADWGWHRKFLSVVGNLFITVVLTDFRIRDWTTGFRAITRKVYQAIAPEMRSAQFTGYAFQVGFLHKAVRRNFKIAEVPFVFVDRTVGHSKLGAEYIKNAFIFVLKVRLEEILNNRIFKFVMVGGMGAFVQLASLHFYRYLLPINHVSFLTAFQEATLLSIETSIVSNFFLSNFWTFRDRPLTLPQIPGKFLQFNLTSMGSLAIQFVINSLGERFIGLFALFTLPLVGITIDTGLIFAVVGILTGMFWNFFAYTKLIWRTKKSADRPSTDNA